MDNADLAMEVGDQAITKAEKKLDDI